MNTQIWQQQLRLADKSLERYHEHISDKLKEIILVYDMMN